MNNLNNPKTVLITGCNQGLGLELVAIFSKNGWNIIAGIRNLNNIAPALYASNINIIELNVQKNDEIANISKKIGETPIDVVINNAGTFKEDNLEAFSVNEMLEMYSTHAIAPLLISQKLLKNVLLGCNKTIVIISGRMGSFNSYSGAGCYSYRASKAAANMVTKIMAYDLKEKNIKVISIHPGWIKTKMGGKDAKIDTHDSANGIFKLISDPHEIETGVFYTFAGQKLEW